MKNIIHMSYPVNQIYEEIYSRIPITAEVEIPALNINFPNTVNLPPGDIIITISLYSKT
jgi:hypothetical protein